MTSTLATKTLFGADEEQPSHRGPFAGVALDQSIDRILDYSIPPRLLGAMQVGQRVRVPLGRKNKPVRGYVVSIREHADFPKIKDILAIDDARVLVGAKLMALAQWMSRYYVAPLGTVIENIIPSAVKKKVGLGHTQIVTIAKGRNEIQNLIETTKAVKRRAILARLLQLDAGGSIELARLAGESGATPPTIRRLARLGIIHIRPEVDLPRLTAGMPASAADEPEIPLNEDQRVALEDMSLRLREGKFSVNLLYGVTGSGKTEVYLRCIRQVVVSGRQAIVLVPEIALTPQTVKRFTARFRRVAILHSGLGATARHRYWQQISQGEADVVVGARSAIFAPVPNLGIVVVDEEHESSYKQDNAPRYHARDVAIKRAQLEDVPVLLGSATPSLEIFHRVTSRACPPLHPRAGRGEEARAAQGTRASTPPHPSPLPDGEGTEEFADSRAKGEGIGELADRRARGDGIGPAYHLLRLPNRVRGLALPHVEVVNLLEERRLRRGVHVLSRRLEFLLRHTIDTGHQAILLLNRRGYSNFVFCPSCGNVIQCKYCDTTMTYHRSTGTQASTAKFTEGIHTGQLHCHYCLAVNPLPEKCPTCGKMLSLFGLGTQRVEEELARKFPDVKFERVDSDSMRRARDYERTLGRFARREIQVLLGTQMIAKGLDYPNVTLVGVISGDTALALPDFRAAERTFQLITQVAGRAGRGDATGRVVLQTFLPDDPAIRSAIKQDYDSFARAELSHRREVGLPPYARMVRIVMRDQDSEKLNRLGEGVALQLADALAEHGANVVMKGPMPCAISKIAGYVRTQIVLTSGSASRLQQVLARVREKGVLAKSNRIAVDVDPVSLL